LPRRRDDPRIRPGQREELPSLALEISVLTERTLLPSLCGRACGRPGRLIVRREQLIALLLRRWARVSLGTRSVLAATCRKAGLPPDALAGTGDRCVHVSGGRVRRDRGRLIPKIVTTPIGRSPSPSPGSHRGGWPRTWSRRAPGAARDRLAAGEVLSSRPASSRGSLPAALHRLQSAVGHRAGAAPERSAGCPSFFMPVFWVAGTTTTSPRRTTPGF